MLGLYSIPHAIARHAANRRTLALILSVVLRAREAVASLKHKIAQSRIADGR